MKIGVGAGLLQRGDSLLALLLRAAEQRQRPAALVRRVASATARPMPCAPPVTMARVSVLRRLNASYAMVETCNSRPLTLRRA